MMYGKHHGRVSARNVRSQSCVHCASRRDILDACGQRCNNVKASGVGRTVDYDVILKTAITTVDVVIHMADREVKEIWPAPREPFVQSSHHSKLFHNSKSAHSDRCRRWAPPKAGQRSATPPPPSENRLPHACDTRELASTRRAIAVSLIADTSTLAPIKVRQATASSCTSRIGALIAARPGMRTDSASS